MFIYIISTSYPDEEFPTKNIFVYEQAKELARRGNRIVVLHVKKMPANRIFKRVNKNVQVFDDGFSIRYFVNQKTFLTNKFPKINRELYLKSVNRLFDAAVKDTGKPDVIYAHFSCFAGLAAARISKKYNIPLVAIEHYGGLLGKTISCAYKSAIIETVKQADAFVCVSEGLKQALCRHINVNNREILVVPNMIDPKFKFVKPIKKNIFIFLAVGNLYKEKGFRILISAFCKAFNPDQQVELRIGGGGPDFNYLQELISKNSRNSQVKLLGRLTREDTIQEYVRCDCFSLASYHETFGMVYREALITGRPIITTDHGGFSGSDWHSIYGEKIPVGDESALVLAFKKMYNTFSEFDYKQISDVCLSDCSSEIVGARINQILESSVYKHI